MALINRALCVTDDQNTTVVLTEGTWNVFSNSFLNQPVILDPTGVATGWGVAATNHSENGLSLVALPFYDPAVYAYPRAVLNVAASITFTITGLNDALLYTFIFTGATSSAIGALTRENTITVDVSGDSDTFYTDALDTDADHRGEVSLQSPSSGTIVVTVTNTGSQQTQISTLEIQEHTAEQEILPTGIASTLAVGTPTVQIGTPLDISPGGIASTLAFGTPVVRVGQPLTFGITGDIDDSIGINGNINDSIGITGTISDSFGITGKIQE